MVLGRILDASVLTPPDLMAIQEICSCINQSTVKVYHRVLISGTVYTTSNYIRSKIRNDYILCMKRQKKIFGSAKQYISFCRSTCTNCRKPCQHVAIVSDFTEIAVNISTDTLTGAALKHIHCVQPTRYVMYIYNYVTIFSIIVLPMSLP